MKDLLTKLEKLNAELGDLDRKHHKFKGLLTNEKVSFSSRALARRELCEVSVKRSLLRGRIMSSQIPSMAVVTERFLLYYKEYSSCMENAYWEEVEVSEKALSFYKDSVTVELKIENLEDLVKNFFTYTGPLSDMIINVREMGLIKKEINFTLVLEDVFPPEVIDFKTEEDLNELMEYRGYTPIKYTNVVRDGNDEIVGTIYKEDNNEG